MEAAPPLVTRALQSLHNVEPYAKLLCLVEVAEKDKNVSLNPQKDLIGARHSIQCLLISTGIFVSPLIVECSLMPAQNSIKDTKERFVFREVKDFCCLLSKDHPSILEVRGFFDCFVVGMFFVLIMFRCYSRLHCTPPRNGTSYWKLDNRF